MKSATSSLHALLARHEKVYIPEGEIHFFCMDDVVQHPAFFFPEHGQRKQIPDYERDFEENLEWYQQFFEPAADDQVIGEDSTIYLPAVDAPKRIAELLPEVKLIFMLRNPVDRTYSHYWHRVKTGRAVYNFKHELQHGPSTLLLRSFYRSQLERYFGLFSRGQIKIILFERFVDHTQEVLDEVCSFIGLSSTVDITRVDSHKNRSPFPLSLSLQLTLNYLTKGLTSRYHEHLPSSDRSQPLWIRSLRLLARSLRKGNLNAGSPPPMAPSLRSRLGQIFARKNRGLSELIGINLGNYWPHMNESP